MKRAAKAAAMAPRPTQLLRPEVHCQTQRYSSKVRLGRGFTLAELKAAGIAPKMARTIGICVDKRRTNKSEEALQANVERLKTYKSKLVLFPRRTSKAKAGDASPEEVAAATQYSGVILPVDQSKDAEVEFAEVTEEMKTFGARSSIRVARNEHKLVGRRISIAKAKAAN
mmetsp:Transcript_25263/g.79273  ORF Transcript_25263/g.79273 Transcript_25263/m.79273 type:complete len:170 (+) Transcript_25263:881-1390(+)